MDLIFCSFISLLTYIIGYLVGKIVSEKRVKESLQNAIASDIKAAKIGIIIRTHRNQLYRRETEIKSDAKSSGFFRDSDYADIKSKLEIVRIIEEDVANEMQEI